MFEYLKDFRAILVTGPQRSGTTLVARMVSFDDGHTYIDEDEIGWQGASQNKEGSLLNAMREQQNIVIQAPACAHICHTSFAHLNDVAVVFVVRDVQDLIASQERIGWEYEQQEMDKYPSREWCLTIAETKYRYWREFQKPIIAYPFEVKYEDLKEHPLWIESREGFAPRQWRVG